MGCFSWMFADKDNKTNLRIDRKGYIACPDGSFIKDSCYEGYGEFTGNDVYELVVEWNRKFIAENPDFVMPHRVWDGKENREFALKDFWWYPIIADLSIPLSDFAKEVERRGKENRFRELRTVGIDIACYSEDNEALPYPIKITQTMKIPYKDLPASKRDPEQGLVGYRR